MKNFMLDQAHQLFLKDWAAKQGVEILDCGGGPDNDFTQEYAKRVGGRVVADPRAGRPANVLVVRELNATQTQEAPGIERPRGS